MRGNKALEQYGYGHLKNTANSRHIGLKNLQNYFA
jgi:hypothetical protein